MREINLIDLSFTWTVKQKLQTMYILYILKQNRLIKLWIFLVLNNIDLVEQ